MPSVLLFATLDTKGREAAFVRGLLASWGVPRRRSSTSARSAPRPVAADVPRAAVFELAGTSLDAIRRNGRSRRGGDQLPPRRGRDLAREAHARGEVAGVLGLGGSAGTTIGTAAMRALPLGVPKVMVSTLASGTVRQFVGDKDIFMLNSVVDILGLNRISRRVLSQAARGDGRPGHAIRRRRRRPTRQAAGGRDDVRRDDAVRRAGARTRSRRPATKCSSSTPPATAARRWSR